MASERVTGSANQRAGRGLRPEARSVWLDTLTDDQERAFEALVRLIEDATDDLPESDEWGEDPRFDRGLDPKQVSRVVLLGGGRGSGKTTVAQTLQEALDPDINEPIYSKRAWSDEAMADRRDRMRDRVKRLSDQIIPLEILRMTETPPGTNVLAAVLARIEQLVFPRLTREDVLSTTGDRRQHDAVLDLLRLQTDVAIAWDGNLRERRGNLDPDNYAMEEMRAERVRLQLQDRFQTVLRRTARESLGHREPAMFLLVVDDVDMDPARLLPLLERLRMVAVPELLVLLVGDIEPIETALRMHYAERYRKPTPDVSPADIAMASQEMAAMTNLIARSALRKHVPYHQRIMLQPRLRARDALRVRPLRRGLEVEDIKTLMDGVVVAYPPVPCRPEADEGTTGTRSTITLRRFVFPEKTTTGDDESSDEATEGDDTLEERYWYVGSRLLADSPRVAVDMWYAALDAQPTGPEAGRTRPPDRVHSSGPTDPEQGAEPLDPRLHTFVRRLAIERIDANSLLWPSEPTVGWEATQRLVRDGDMTGFEVTAEHRFEREEHQELELPGSGNGPDPGGPESGKTVIRWSRHNDLTFEVRGQPATRVDVGPLVLASDLASLEDRAVAGRAMAAREKWRLSWVEVGPDQADRRWSWEIPPYRTIRQIEQFGQEWNAFLDGPSEEPGETVADRAVDLAEAWVRIHTGVLFGVKENGDFPIETTRQQLIDLLHRADEPPARDEWATRVAKAWLHSVDRVLRTVGRDLRHWVGKDRHDEEAVAQLVSRALEGPSGSR